MPKGAKAQHAKKKQEKKKPAGKPKGISFSRIGRALGNFVSPNVGTVASIAGKAIDRVLGHGDYTVRMNTIMSNQAPQFASTGTGMRIAHREYLCDVASTVAFSTREYLINPGNRLLFPWLSTIANSFEEYELKGLLVTYKPTSGTAISSTSAAMGSVILSTEYDVLKPTFTSKQEMEAYQYTTPTVPYGGCIHPVECAPSMTVLPKKYVTDKIAIGALDADDDPRLHYLGRFVYATTGQQSNASALGELWVSYDVVFYKPRLPPISTLSTPYACYMVPLTWGAGTPTSPVSVPTSNIITNPTITFDDALDALSHWSTSVEFNEPGTYLCLAGTLIYSASGSAASFSGNPTPSGGASIVYAFTNDSDSTTTTSALNLIKTTAQGINGGFDGLASVYAFFIDTPAFDTVTFPAISKGNLRNAGHMVYHVVRVGKQGMFTKPALSFPAPLKLVRQQGYIKEGGASSTKRNILKDTSAAAAARIVEEDTEDYDKTEESEDSRFSTYQVKDLRSSLDQLHTCCMVAMKRGTRNVSLLKDSLNFIDNTLIQLADDEKSVDVVSLCKDIFHKMRSLQKDDE